jgi:sphinganine C4-monooxygenase
MHLNKYLYTAFHSRHHRLYVPYAYGALYNHPVEGFLLDTLGAGVAYLVSAMTTRQSMWFFTFCTIKTVDDHCGYSLPWDPLQRITNNNAGYHDIHHQSWGIKTNFSQPFFTFWDRLMGTMWNGGDVSMRYERTKRAAEAWIGKEKNGFEAVVEGEGVAAEKVKADQDERSTEGSDGVQSRLPASKVTAQAVLSRKQVLQNSSSGAGGRRVLREEAAEEKEEKENIPPRRKSPRKKLAKTGLNGHVGMQRVDNR